MEKQEFTTHVWEIIMLLALIFGISQASQLSDFTW